LKKLNLLRPGVRLLNLAPEPFMLFVGSPLLEGSYEAADYDPLLFARWNKPIRKLDLCKDLGTLTEGNYDVILHNHVLEHVPCNVVSVLNGLNRAIARRGYHLFSVPVYAGTTTKEDLNPMLSEAERCSRFGQKDHMRIFGELDFMNFLEQADMTKDLVDITNLFEPNELSEAALPAAVLKSINSDRVFVYRKP